MFNTFLDATKVASFDLAPSHKAGSLSGPMGPSIVAIFEHLNAKSFVSMLFVFAAAAVHALYNCSLFSRDYGQRVDHPCMQRINLVSLEKGNVHLFGC